MAYLRVKLLAVGVFDAFVTLAPSAEVVRSTGKLVDEATAGDL